MSKEFLLKTEVDARLQENNYERPVHLSIANQIIELLAANIEALNLEKKKKKTLKATIFTYLTAGSSSTTYDPVRNDGNLKRSSRKYGRRTHRNSPSR